MSVLDLQRFAIESAMQSGKSFRIEADGTLVFDVGGKPTKMGYLPTPVTDMQLTPSMKVLNTPKDKIFRRVSGPMDNRLTIYDILFAASRVGESIKIKATDSGVRLAAKELGYTGKFHYKNGITTFTRES